MKKTTNGALLFYSAPRITLDEVDTESGFAASVGASTEGFDVKEETWTW